MKNVLLIGIGGVYNYGCEAIVRGTIEILRNVDPAIKISYASYNYEDDVQRLADCDLKILQRKRLGRWNPKTLYVNCLHLLASLLLCLMILLIG